MESVQSILFAQFPHYLKPWRPERKLSVRTARTSADAWRIPPAPALPGHVADLNADLTQHVALFTVARYALAGLEGLEASVDPDGKVGVDELALRRVFDDMAGFLGSIKLVLAERMGFRLFAVAPGSRGLLFATSLARVRGALATKSERCGVRDALVNISPASVGFQWCPKPLTACGASSAASLEQFEGPAGENPLPLTRVTLDADEGVVYPAGCLVDVDTSASDGFALLLAITAL